VLLYAITSRMLLGDTEAERAQRLIALAAGWAAHGIDFIQIRESDLSVVNLTGLASSVVRAVGENGSRTQVLINARPITAISVALESSADGVHLPGGLDPEQMGSAVFQIRKTWPTSAPSPIISVSCHSVAEIRDARGAGATLALYAPVFEKVLPGGAALPGRGLNALAEACRAARQPSTQPELPVLALGGITLENAHQCVAAGATGIAAIRLFLNLEGHGEQDWQRLSHRAEIT
jgi:thiamine-phosphate pyrophosphorylase